MSIPKPPKRPGPPKGTPKPPGSGRKPGQRNKITATTREAISLLGKPIETLCAISAGKRIRVIGPDGRPAWTWPTLDQRSAAAGKLITRLVPQLSDVAISGPDGGPIAVQHEPLDYMEAA